MRVITAREQIQMLAPWRVAADIMGDELGNEVHYKPGPHNHSAVAEDEHGNYLGGLEWAKYPSIVTRGKPVEWIETHPAARRRGIATGLFNWARENVDPKLEHSTHVTPAGKGWAQSMGFKTDRTKGQKWTKVQGYW